MSKTQTLYKKAKKIIPGGTQLLTKRPEMMLPNIWPAYYKKAKGCEIWDMDNNKYTDMGSMGIGSCILGYADDDVNKRVKEVVEAGNMTTLNAPEEVELAEILCELHPWADMVRYARTGGEAMAIAIRIARAKTQKDIVLFCGYHGWHDWYLAANLSDDKALDGHLLPGLKPLGVPRALKGTAIPFHYNNTQEFLDLIGKYKKNVGVVVMESIRNHYPEKDFIETIRDITKKSGLVLIFDEITAGWRLTVGGGHLLFDIEPDIAVFGKAISNGFPMAAIIGKKEVMEMAQESFISSTYWTDRIGPVAAIATIKKLQKMKVPDHLANVGKKIQDGWKTSAIKNDINISIYGTYPLSHFSFNYENPLIFQTLFTQSMLEKGLLASTNFYASYAHKAEHIEQYLEAVDETFNLISQSIRENKTEKYLKGPIRHSGFVKLT
ncbi:aminotransferase class III-fold pyridoxal phosphate-dependent enzyme [bacterium AH-315-M05]|nr:aminotransferase class III-fold pyridoxal phosphate-dependent enzyme [bacterium AH-315-M05]